METNKQENTYTTITVDNASISKPFTGKDDKEYVQITCPAESKFAKKSFIVPAEYVRQSKFDENQSFFSFPTGYNINLRKSVKTGEKDGKAVFGYEQSTASPEEVKAAFSKSLKKSSKVAEQSEESESNLAV